MGIIISLGSKSGLLRLGHKSHFTSDCTNNKWSL